MLLINALDIGVKCVTSVCRPMYCIQLLSMVLVLFFTHSGEAMWRVAGEGAGTRREALAREIIII